MLHGKYGNNGEFGIVTDGVGNSVAFEGPLLRFRPLRMVYDPTHGPNHFPYLVLPPQLLTAGFEDRVEQTSRSHSPINCSTAEMRAWIGFTYGKCGVSPVPQGTIELTSSMKLEGRRQTKRRAKIRILVAILVLHAVLFTALAQIKTEMGTQPISLVGGRCTGMTMLMVSTYTGHAGYCP